MISSRQNNDDRTSTHGKFSFLFFFFFWSQSSLELVFVCIYGWHFVLDCWYITYLFNIYYSQVKIETMIYCVCDTSQEWTSDVWTISCVRLSKRIHRTSDVLIAREKKTCVYILNILSCLHIHTSYWDLLFIHSLFLKQNKKSLFRQLLMFLIISASHKKRKKARLKAKAKKNPLFLLSFPFIWQCSMCVCVCLGLEKSK